MISDGPERPVRCAREAPRDVEHPGVDRADVPRPVVPQEAIELGERVRHERTALEVGGVDTLAGVRAEHPDPAGLGSGASRASGPQGEREERQRAAEEEVASSTAGRRGWGALDWHGRTDV